LGDFSFDVDLLAQGAHTMPHLITPALRKHGAIFSLLWALLLSACGGGNTSETTVATVTSTPAAVFVATTPLTASSPTASTTPAASTVTLLELGRLIFNDKALSTSGKMACATCHDPAFGHASNSALGATIAGGTDGLQPGQRNVPTLGYLRFVGPLGVNLAEAEVYGGLNWDGSANSFLEQAQRPFLSNHEMGNLTPDAFLEKLSKASYFSRFAGFFGKEIASQPAKALEASAAAVAEFQAVDPSFASFDSKFDAVQAGKTLFSVQEARGFAWFSDPAKGNCTACHSAKPVSAFIPALFTDFGYDNVGVPRNMDIAANQNPEHFDLGVCKSSLGRVIDLTPLCGAFKAPTLRNVSKTAPYFHNGKFATLKEVLEFYVTRDTDPARWYPSKAGIVDTYNDVPLMYKKNVNTEVAPYDRKPGDAPALTTAEIEDVLVFLKTLDDGWKPALGSAAASTMAPAKPAR
jgi:cytochrome c peroxidase